MELKYILGVTWYLKSNSYHFISFYLYLVDNLKNYYVYFFILCPGIQIIMWTLEI